MRRRAWWLIIPALLLSACVPAESPTGGSSPTSEPVGVATTELPDPDPIEDEVRATVVGVTDGDTFQAVLENDSKSTIIRLIGVDTPESVGRYRSHPQCYGKEASAYLKSSLTIGEEILLTLDKESHDRFKRLLAYVWDEHQIFVNDDLVARGYAKTLRIKPNTRYAENFKRSQANAKDAKVGIWKHCVKEKS